ncbi:WYL domain-containing protein [Limibacter armeniacum]|uniref:helix-turn-helix transcriptional regulator n=1 Tax=Limibacter armeniacum TaxID=466084 RepID=UPI002FE61D27
MPTQEVVRSSKLSLLRYMLIDSMIRSKFKPFPTKQEILDACEERFGVRSISTIEKDLNAMRFEFDAPIEYSKKSKGYYYSDPSFKLLGMNFSKENLEALQFVGMLLEGFRDLPVFNEFSDAVDKVLDGVEITRQANDSERPFGNFIQIDKSGYIKGSDILANLIRIVKEKGVVRIGYQKFGSEEWKHYTVHAYLLKEYKDLWYLTGFVEERNEVRTFGVDRITTVEELNKGRIEESEVNFDPDNFFRYCLGVTALAEEPQEIMLSFTPQMGNYIKTSPVHHTQEIVQDDEDVCVVRLKLVNNHELRNWILGFGASVKVLKPEKLKEQIKEEILQSMLHYDKA